MLESNATTPLASNASTHFAAPVLLMINADRIARTIMQEMFIHCGYQVLTAENDEAGLHILRDNHSTIDLVILENEIPDINGHEFITHMKAEPQFTGIPIIMTTDNDDPERIQECIDAGVYYYLIKPVDGAVLKSIVSAALRERRQRVAMATELNRYGAALKVLHSCQISVQTLEEAKDTACFLASCFPDPNRVVAGLSELLTNAIEHGNLGITYEEKKLLIANNIWQEEVTRRLKLPENANKYATVTYHYKDGNYLVQIMDSGTGFDWKRFWHINPIRATASHGRGIAQARTTSFDKMAYNEKGNSVTVMVIGKDTGNEIIHNSRYA